jgi:PAS domain S-box-containing protein
MKLDVNKLLKLRIRGKLAIAFAGLSIIPVLVVGLLGISTNVDSLRRMAIENLDHDLRTIRERVQAFFQGMEDNSHFLTTSASFQQFLDSLHEPDTRVTRQALRRLLPELQSFARRKRILYQIKFIDRNGSEVFALEDRQGEPRIVPQAELRETGNQFYLHLAAEVPANRATFVPVELWNSRENKLLPAISCVYPITRSEFSGILVFHIYAKSFFELIEQATPHSPVGTVMLVNAEGYYLYHSGRKKDWNRLLASKNYENLKNDFGDEFAQHLLGENSPSLQEINGSIVAHAPLFSEPRTLGGRYTILKSVSKSQIFAPVTRFRQLFLALLGFFLLASLSLAFLATRQFTRPIQKLRREVDVIAKGDFHSRVDVKTYDEIEDLAHQFNVMAESLEQREAEIVRHRERLEQMVQQRTKALEEEKNKMQVILDNVPSGFLLLDRDYTIRSASAAMETITGEPVEKLVGRKCYEVVGDGEQCLSCPTFQVFRSGKVEAQLMKQITPEGKERYLEHVSVPLNRDEEAVSVLEIITDVTERQRLQEQLIRSERLATTGEIAAVIAHEMRNSLTSVRMILQLLAETDRLTASDRESLEVALDSLGRMDRVVNDLLQLARPAQLQKRVLNFNEVIADSIEFARPQVARKGIDLVANLAPDLPDMLIDRDQMKEALVNLILNAAQAIKDRGKIKIRSSRVSLSSELRELAEVAGSDAIKVQEVVLKKGTPVLKVDIADSGCGIPEEHLRRIFDPFFTTKTNGTGLGLSFVKRVVNEHGGVVTVSSKLGGGSVFSLLLPITF